MTDLFHARAVSLDAADPLAGFRDRFAFPDPDLVYFDGNSLGRLPVATAARLRQVVDEEWGGELVGGWDRWIGLARQAGDLIADGILEAAPGEVGVCDSTSVNLYKLAAAALAARPGRPVVVTDDENFPGDLYVLQGLAPELRLVHADPAEGVVVAAVEAALGDDVAVVSLSHVAYGSGAVADLAAITEAAHAAGALTLWDLCHSVGSVPVPLASAGADLAVGCTYKYLNAGPGAPAFVYVRRDLQAELRQPIWGWFGQRDQFALDPAYDPVETIDRFQVGTPPVLGVYAVLAGAEITAEAGIGAIHAKGQALTSYAVDVYDEWLAPLGFALASPRDPVHRGAHVTFRHPQAWQLCQALKAAKVVPDFRAPDRLRIGLAPLYTRFVDVYEGFARLRAIVSTGAHRDFPAQPSRVT